jgi:plasmid stabilization system protein ParE
MNKTALPYEITVRGSYESELSEIIEYLTENASYKVALQLMEDIDSQLDIITTLPYLYPAYIHVPRFRKMSIHNWQYVVFYTVNKQKRQITLAHIYHTSRDIHSMMT